MGFFSSFFGGDQRKDLRNSKAAADAALKTGYDQSIGYGNQAFDLYNPYSQQGGQANQMYGQTLGLGTDAERTAAEAQYFNDPAMQQVLGQQSNALLRKYNADGSGTGGGRLALAGARVGLENYGNWQNRLQGLGQQGAQATGQQANIRQGQGDTSFGYGATLAGNNINFGNAMSASRNTGINNLLGVLGVGAKFLNPTPTNPFQFGGK